MYIREEKSQSIKIRIRDLERGSVCCMSDMRSMFGGVGGGDNDDY